MTDSLFFLRFRFAWDFVILSRTWLARTSPPCVNWLFLVHLQDFERWLTVSFATRCGVDLVSKDSAPSLWLATCGESACCGITILVFWIVVECNIGDRCRDCCQTSLTASTETLEKAYAYCWRLKNYRWQERLLRRELYESWPKNATRILRIFITLSWEYSALWHLYLHGEIVDIFLSLHEMWLGCLIRR